MWDEMLSSGKKCYHLELCYHLGRNVIIWDYMLSCGMQYYHLELMLSSNVANVKILQSGANVIIWCYHVMLSSGMITPPFFIFPGNFTHSKNFAMKYISTYLSAQFSGSQAAFDRIFQDHWRLSKSF